MDIKFFLGALFTLFFITACESDDVPEVVIRCTNGIYLATNEETEGEMQEQNGKLYFTFTATKNGWYTIDDLDIYPNPLAPSLDPDPEMKVTLDGEFLSPDEYSDDFLMVIGQTLCIELTDVSTVFYPYIIEIEFDLVKEIIESRKVFDPGTMSGYWKVLSQNPNWIEPPVRIDSLGSGEIQIRHATQSAGNWGYIVDTPPKFVTNNDGCKFTMEISTTIRLSSFQAKFREISKVTGELFFSDVIDQPDSIVFETNGQQFERVFGGDTIWGPDTTWTTVRYRDI